ncbi:UDP-glycosyltransferase 83A1 [Abeliophyllum distichum]|uniref:UDP-glycosyltransferase 83A1 n=1 Tax=Abeliophyllum distichum TaxID=126358 RepID=A0ABD1NSC5_9LAMI
MVSLPDGLESSDDRSEIRNLSQSIFYVMPGELKALIEWINGSESEKIRCLIDDATMGWALKVAEKMGIKKVDFWLAAAALLPLLFKIPSLIDDGIIDNDGCLAWLDQRPPDSVIYVAFGSFTVFHHNQFKELALGLELTGRPFLWVVRQNITEDVDNTYPTGFKERVHHRGRMVSWAPQQKVLSHPCVACFISRCSWNSTIEGISNGIHFLCWPYFSDQIFNKSYIYDYLKIGLELNKDDNGIIRRGEIKNKLERVLGDEGLKEIVLYFQAKTLNGVIEGGSSSKSSSELRSRNCQMGKVQVTVLNNINNRIEAKYRK